MAPPKRHPEYEDWINQETATVNRWLMRPGVDDLIIRLVHEWNVRELLGVDLSHQLRDLVFSKLEDDGHRAEVVRAALNEVDWNQLAEQYALRFTGTDERELIMRRLVEARRMIC